jgi:hypothetical protein
MQLLAQQTPSKVWQGPSALAVASTRSIEPAWQDDTKPTNYRLKDCDRVELKADARGDFSDGKFVVPAGTVGVVVTARTPRVFTRSENKSIYFANVDVLVDGKKGRIRVPHGALRIIPATRMH